MPERWIVSSEFAEVAVSLDREANGPRLRLEDLRGGWVCFMSALDLEAVIWGPPGHLEMLLDPSAGRWSDD